MAAGAQDSGLWPGPPGGGGQRPTGHCLGYDSTGYHDNTMQILWVSAPVYLNAIKMYDRKWWPMLMCELFIFGPTF